MKFISVKLQAYSVQIAHYFGKLLDVTEEAMKIHPWWKLFFSKNASLKFIPCDFIKNEFHHRDYLAWVLQGTFFNILENFLRGITVISFIQEVITLLKGLGLVS